MTSEDIAGLLRVPGMYRPRLQRGLGP